ncbi:HET-domain-containing protein [Coniochaeta ligniaria NRRL 30616]|uniref:HET-domain-containing protein n=1 Tax=Coniochaeta ligniaria NRRL 30616 TaxID=1408157 RepID=A0A1J7J614_9PEZI|nr:HET-domain-containing protein [Coniochaeta ligniaria NRRL 30616]
MALCSLCANIKYDDLFAGRHIPWGRTVSDLWASTPTCELCALFVSAWQDNPPLRSLPDNRLYLAGNCNIPSLRNPTEPRRIHSVSLYVGGDSAGLAGVSAKAENVSLRVMCDDTSELAGQILYRPIGPADSTWRVREWLKECNSGHRDCAGLNNTVLPTRLIDVGDADKLPRLVETGGCSGQYIALSHRWGGAYITQTTRVNVHEHKVAVPFGHLCATFQDAIVITRKLGHRYLWIDSLCIIQDSAEDWDRESAQMAVIYQRAALTLAAACATSGDTGLFQRREPCRSVAMFHKDSSGRVLSSYSLARDNSVGFSTEVVDGPLNTRAWCLQERHLSSRTVHYGQTQLFWECQSAAWQENIRDAFTVLDRFDGELRSGFVKRLSEFPWRGGPMPTRREDTADEYSTWYWLVSQYSRRALTVADDKLTAMSGLASVFASHRRDTYAAGLWERDLPVGMLWCAERGKQLHRAATYRAPSWSWAAWDGEIDTNFSWDGKIEVEDIAIFIELSGSNPFGRVKSGRIDLRGPIEKINLGQRINPLERGPEGSGFAWHCANIQLLDDVGVGVGEGSLDDPDETQCYDDTTFCLMLFRVEVGFRPLAPACLENKGDWAWCLLLKHVGHQQYARVGLAQVHQAFFSSRTTQISIL